MSTGMDDFERWLRDHPRALGEDDPGDEDEASPHVDAEALAVAIEAGERWDDATVAHLASCGCCRAAAAELVRQVRVAAPRPQSERAGRWIPRWLLAPQAMALAAACAVIAAIWLPGILDPPEPIDEYAPRGVSAPGVEPAAVALLATGPDGGTRNLRAEPTVFRTERLGFRYGNPAGAHATLAILGWDGEQIHWYYPEGPGGAAVRLDKGPDARGVRLPFDIALGDKHRAGALTVVAAFDLDPEILAGWLRDGRALDDERLRVFRLTLEEGKR